MTDQEKIESLEKEMSVLRNSNSWGATTLLAVSKALEMDADSTLKDLPALAEARMKELKELRAKNIEVQEITA
jgi:hypothetical protein